MRTKIGFLICVLLICTLPATAKGKKKVLLTDDVLQAQTVYVMADPDAGIAAEDPLANRTARLDVESAIQKWGRFHLVRDAYGADLVIVVRRGNGKMARPTIGGVPISNDPVMVPTNNPGDASQDRPISGAPGGYPTNSQGQLGPSPQMEIGSQDDMFTVYRGHFDDPMTHSPVWRYSAKDALRGPAVRAVDEFQKVIAEAEKQRDSNP